MLPLGDWAGSTGGFCPFVKLPGGLRFPLLQREEGTMEKASGRGWDSQETLLPQDCSTTMT